MDAGIRYAFVGNLPGHPGNHTYCPKCGKVVIKRSGFRYGIRVTDHLLAHWLPVDYETLKWQCPGNVSPEIPFTIPPLSTTGAGWDLWQT